MQKSVMQTVAWAEFKHRFGWSFEQLFDLFVLTRTIKFGFDVAYIPEITLDEHSFSAQVARAQSALSKVKKPSTIFGRAEFLIPYRDTYHAQLLQAGFRKSKDEVQPEHRQIIDLTPSLNDIRSQMKSKGRYNIGLAEKKGVLVKAEDSAQAIEEFTALSRDTASRKGFVGRSDAYLHDLIAMLHHEHLGELVVARYQSAMLSAAIVTYYGQRASYLYGVSSSENRAVMAPYLLHYSIIEEAKRRGCTEYDLIGVAPLDASSGHSWAGISRFKREFGGQTVRYLGSYDRVYRPTVYALYTSMRSHF